MRFHSEPPPEGLAGNAIGLIIAGSKCKRKWIVEKCVTYAANFGRDADTIASMGGANNLTQMLYR